MCLDVRVAFDYERVDPAHRDMVGRIMAALTCAFSENEEGAVEILTEAKTEDAGLTIDFMFGSMLGLIAGWAESMEVDPLWLLQEIGRRSARIFVGLDPDTED